jgi:isopropylmalate/homocitrate/citramalate synthase
MSDLPTQVEIHEEGPREGFQIEPGPISTADKIRLIEALAETGLHHIQAASFVSPRIVPGWADAEDVVAGLTPKAGVHYTALWFNASGLNRALVFRNKLTVSGSIALTASEAFTQKNLHRSHAENVEAMKKQTALHLDNNVEVPRIGVMAAFGCNYQGDIAPSQVISTLEDGLAIAEEAGADIKYFSLADTMGWATPMRIERVLAEVRSRWPDTRSPCTCTIREGSPSPMRMPGSGWASPNSTRPSVGWAVARSLASQTQPAISAPRSWCCSARRWASIPVSISMR